MSKLIAVVDDEPDIVELIAHNLKKENFRVKEFYEGTSLLSYLENVLPDLIILDLMLPEIDGLELCKILKMDERTSSVPIIMLTAKATETDKVVGLELGADDYVTKPFSPKELIARIKAIFRRVERMPEKQKAYRYGKLILDLSKHEVTFNNAPIELTSKEFNLLKCLLQSKGRVLSRDYLMDEVWGYDYYGGMRTVDVHIRRLREKIPYLSEAIQTVKNLGYKLKEHPPA